MRIAFVSYDFGEYSVQHANGLLADGEVLLIVPAELVQPYESMMDARVDTRVFSKPRLRQVGAQVATLRWIGRQLADFQPDVVHFQSGHMWFNLMLPWLRRRYPIVFTVHDPRHHVGDRGSHNTPQWIMDFGFRRADQIIVHASQLKAILSDEVGIPDDRIHVIPHIAIGQRDIRRTDSDSNHVLFFGRIWPYKGLEYLIRAQPLINQQVPDAKFLVCGQGEDIDRYHRMMQDPERFEIHNRWIQDNERVDFFQRASVVVLPYVEATQSGVVPIAYAHYKPVVATRTGGLPDVIEHGRTGMLVEPCNVRELADAIIKLLKNKDLREEMGNAGNRKLKKDLAASVICKQTANVYRQAISGRNTASASAGRNLSRSV